MDLRCLVFSSDDASAPLICQALAELGAEADHCPDAAAAIGRVASESFQIVIADWDEQPNAEYLLKAARSRKAADRPLTLAIVSDDASVPRALQAGANSVLRKPILLNQVKDTLETARSLLKAKKDTTAPGASTPPAPSTNIAANEAHLRAGDFLTSARPAPGAQFDTEPEVSRSLEASSAVVDPLKDLEPTAASVTPEQPAPQTPPAPAPQANESRGLQWYLNQKAASLPSTPTVPMPAPPPAQQPELMGYDLMAAHPEPAPATPAAPPPAPKPDPVREQKAEAELFSYITHGSDDSTSDAEQSSGGGIRLGKRAIGFALVLAACAIAAAPQAPWHPAAQRLWAHGQRALHSWLNPQVVEPAQAPEAHENFGRAGDEYKLPVPENIPDATTDPSQIRVVPVVDPTAKKPGSNGTDQNDDTAVNPGDSTSPPAGQTSAGQASAGQTPGTQTPQNPSQPAPGTSPQGTSPPGTSPQPAGQSAGQSLGQSAATPVQPANVSAAPIPSKSSSASPPVNAPTSTTLQKPNPGVQIAAATPPIPSSLRSQMASTVPDSSGNKNPETALPSIEPVAVPESAERTLITAQSAIAYPDNARGQQGTVILQLLIGRDGSVQDAKFLQGSLAFARAAIDGVRAWKFKPYVMNGRPVSVQTQLTLSFSPAK